MNAAAIGVELLPQVLAAVGVTPVPSAPTWTVASDDEADAFVETLYNEHAQGLVHMVRLFVDDRNAAEDIVQEAFIRLARSVHRIDDDRKAAAYLRSIVLNLARDHNRRGLVSLRHRLPLDDSVASVEDTIVLSERQQQVIEALNTLPYRQRDCLVLRYYDELGIDDIADTLGISRNSVKTHLTRAMRGLEERLDEDEETVP